MKFKSVATLLLLMVIASPATAQHSGTFDGPDGFIPPPLNPAGIELETRELGPGVYALLSNQPAVDNSGFIIGERGVLVIDAHINGNMARQIQKAVRRITSKPILYLVNTNYHGDHTFGNYAFPAETLIVAHRETARQMQHFEEERSFLLATVNGDRSVLADVELRLPDVIFDDHLRLDLGDRQVHVYHFGPGNTLGDTVVYEPRSETAWTGNLILGEGLIPFLIEGRPGTYLETVSRFASTLEVRTIIPGHGVPTTAAIFPRYVGYLSELIESVRVARRSGQSLATVLEAGLGKAYEFPSNSPLVAFWPFISGIHKWNVEKSYLELVQN